MYTELNKKHIFIVDINIANFVIHIQCYILWYVIHHQNKENLQTSLILKFDCTFKWIDTPVKWRDLMYNIEYHLDEYHR